MRFSNLSRDSYFSKTAFYACWRKKTALKKKIFAKLFRTPRHGETWLSTKPALLVHCFWGCGETFHHPFPREQLDFSVLGETLFMLLFFYFNFFFVTRSTRFRSSDGEPKRNWDRRPPRPASWSDAWTCGCWPAERPRCIRSEFTSRNKYTTMFSDTVNNDRPVLLY